MGLLAKIPRWATGGTAQVTEPSEAIKDVGWTPGQKPPAQWFNWLAKVTGDALTVLDGLQNLALTWGLKQTFSAGLSSGAAAQSPGDVTRLADIQFQTYANLTPAGASFTAGSEQPAAYRNATGRIFLEGQFVTAAGGSAAGATLTVLPVGFRPTTVRLVFVAVTDNGVGAMQQASLGTDGTLILINALAGGKAIMVSGINFRGA